MSGEPLDLVLPFYGDPGLLFETVASVLDQDDPRWRLIVVDDGHPDPRVRERLTGLADPRIAYHRNEARLGANGNYRRGLGLATARHVVVLGADDRLLPHYVGRVHALLSRGPVPDVLQPGVEVIDQHGRPVRPRGDRLKQLLRPRGRSVDLRGEAAVTGLMHGNWTYFPSLVWRRELVLEVGLRGYEVVQDLALLVDVLLAGGMLRVDGQVVFQYRRHLGSDSAVKSLSGERFDEERAYYRTIAADLRGRGWDRAARAAAWHWTSRVHALTLLPTAVGRGASPRALLRHALGRGGSPAGS